MNKELFGKKTFWSGLATMTTAILTVAGQLDTNLGHGIMGILGSLTVIFLRDGMITETKK